MSINSRAIYVLYVWLSSYLVLCVACFLQPILFLNMQRWVWPLSQRPSQKEGHAQGDDHESHGDPKAHAVMVGGVAWEEE